MRLGDLLDVSVLKTLAQANFNATGMPMGIVDAVDGSVLVGFGWQDICVMFHRAHPVSAQRCRESDEYVKAHLSEVAPCEYHCKNGLRDIGIPIRVAGEHLATLFLGQFFYEGESPDREFFVRQAMALGFDEAAYLAALDRVPVFSRATVANVLAYDTALARVISDLAEGSLRRREAEARAEFLARFPKESPDPVLRVASDLTVLYANDAARSMLRDGGIDSGGPAPAVIADVARRARSGEGRVRAEIAIGDRSFSISAIAVGSEVNLYAQDITARKIAEDELDRERTRWRGVVEGIADEVWVCDANGRMGLINPPEVTAMGLEEFDGKTVEEVLEEVDILYLDGRPQPPEEAPLLRSLRSGEIVRGEEIMRHRASGRIRYRQFSCAPTRDATGTITGAVAIARDVTESKRIEEALREADRRKDEFLGMLSHELRNPLAPIRNALDILRHVRPGSKEATRAQSVISRQTEHLTRLVDDLLEVSRITRGKITLEKSSLDLAEVTRNTTDDYRSLFADAGVELAIDLPVRQVPVEGDEVRLTQVVGNLLHNAAKFTPRGGRASVRVDASGNRARLTVRDTGAGIDPATRERLFQPFTQADRTLARSSGGLGLGLSLVKGIVDLHGGTVEARSDGVGRGCEFVVELPLGSDLPRFAPAEPPESPSRSLRVLVVEDNEDAAETLRMFLEMEGHVVEVARDGNEGISNAHRFVPDVVLCDIGLPGKDGYEVARQIRSDAPIASAVLVAVTGYAAPEDVRRASEAGFDHHVPKPADMSAVRHILASAAG